MTYKFLFLSMTVFYRWVMILTKLNHKVGSFEYSLPISFIDDSNGNDICASIYSQLYGLKIFIDHIDPIKREEPSYSRFAVYKTNEYGETEDLILESECWSDILSFLNSKRSS